MAHFVNEPGPTKRLSRDRSLRIVASFAIPIAQLEVPGGTDLAARLRPVLLDKEKDPAVRNERRRNTQYGPLFESRFDLFRWPEAPVQELARVVHGAVGSLVRELNDYSIAEMQAFELQYHAWFHVTRKGGYQGLHHHANASWSGIFCVDPGDAVAGRPDSGTVRFHDPRLPEMWADPGNCRLKMPFNSGSYEITHRAGQLVIFPSYMPHEIFPYLGERERIVVAFNCWLRTRGAR